MKRTFAACFLLYSATLLAEEPTHVTPELAELKKHYQQDVEFVVRPVRDRYVSSLRTLLRTVAQRGDAASVVAVQLELTNSTRAATLLGLWKYQGPDGAGVREFRPDNTFAVKQDGPGIGKWEITSDKLKLTYPDGSDVFPLPINSHRMLGRSSVNVDVTLSKD